jgi:PAS domain S-box-containing protein
MNSEEFKDYAYRLQGIIDAAIDGIITIDDKGIIESINNAAASQFKYHADEVIGRNISMLMPQPYRSEHDGYLNNYKKTRKPKIIGIGREVIGLKKDGTEFPFSLAVSEVILHNRVIFTGIIHDLSEIKQAQRDLLNANKELESRIEERTMELEEAVNGLLSANEQLLVNKSELTIALDKEKELNELKSRFVSMASHEFRTPLSTILSSAALISKYTDSDQNDKRIKHVSRIKSAVQNLTGILNDFLSLSKIEEGKENVIFEEFNFNDVCSVVIDELKSILKPGQKIDFDSSIEKIVSDKRIIKNILFNILSNSIKYSKDDSLIFINTLEENDKLFIHIKDQGIGIPESEMKYLFSRFFRASNVENIKGTGLGLNIVKRYLELINGHIDIKSKMGHGTEITIQLDKSK